jgi:hypothetical protein
VKLTPNQKRALRRLWTGDLDLDEIAEELTFSTYEWGLDGEVAEVTTFTVATILDAAGMLGLKERVQEEVYIPNPEQIRVAAAEIRAGWSPREREERLKSAWPSLGRLDDTGDDYDAGGSASPDCPE